MSTLSQRDRATGYVRSTYYNDRHVVRLNAARPYKGTPYTPESALETAGRIVSSSWYRALMVTRGGK
jgi:hypothetical protein